MQAGAQVAPNAPPRSAPVWLRLVGPIAAAVLLARIDLGEVAASLAEVRWQPLALALVLVAPLFVAKAWRWRLLLDACGECISLRDAVRLYAISAGAGALTPGAVGDFWKGLSPVVGRKSVGLWTSAIDRAYDLAMLLLLGLVISVAWLHGRAPRVAALCAISVVVAAFWAGRMQLLDMSASILPRFPNAAEALHASAWAAASATVFATCLAFVRFELLVMALGLSLGWPQSFVAFVLTSGVAALPLSVSGLGTRDVALLGYLRTCGISSADAIALSSLCLLLFVWNGVIAACLWLMQPPHHATI
jgi:glycosyltransferase 2 family protein